MKEAMFYCPVEEEKDTVACKLCPHECVLKPGKTGLCRARKNSGGKLFSLTFDEFVSVSMDPIEKKPLYHFYPGSDILSVGTTGCNFRCLNCQNWGISQSDYGKTDYKKLSSEDAVRIAGKYNSIGIAYTYNEPFMNYEWDYQTAQLMRKNNMKNVFVTNGYINPEPLKNIVDLIDAANVDVKSFSDEFYGKVCSGRLEPVLKTIETLLEEKKHVEITYLVLPGKNDSEDEFEKLAGWISSLSNEIPLHFSRYYPNYKMQENATPLKTLEKARQVALKKLKYVYLGNVWENEYNRTYCPVCNNVLVERVGFTAEIKGLRKDGFCGKCNTKINIIM